MEERELSKLAALEDAHWWYAERRRMLRQAIGQLERGRSIDVGSGPGGNSLVLTKLGWDNTAVEMSETGAVLARGRGLQTVRGDATSLPFADQSLDLVVAMDIWEHVADDSKAANEAFRVLHPGGRLYVTVPCDMELWSAHDVAVDHVRRYARGELTALASSAGFEVDSEHSWMVLLRPVVKWRRSDKGAPESDLQPVPVVLNAALRAVVTAERFLPVKDRRGVSLVLQGRRPS